MTRMRFVLADPKKADVKKIEAMKVVKGSFTQAIGNTVSEFYKDFTAVAGIEGVSKDAVKAAAGANQNVLQRAAAIAAEICALCVLRIFFCAFRQRQYALQCLRHRRSDCSRSETWSYVRRYFYLSHSLSSSIVLHTARTSTVKFFQPYFLMARST